MFRVAEDLKEELTHKIDKLKKQDAELARTQEQAIASAGARSRVAQLTIAKAQQDDNEANLDATYNALSQASEELRTAFKNNLKNKPFGDIAALRGLLYLPLIILPTLVMLTIVMLFAINKMPKPTPRRNTMMRLPRSQRTNPRLRVSQRRYERTMSAMTPSTPRHTV